MQREQKDILTALLGSVDISTQPDYRTDKLQKTEKTAGKFVIAGKHTTKMLDLVDETLHQMPLSVPPAVIGPFSKRAFRSLVRWNHRFHLLRHDPVVKYLGRVPAVSDQPLESESFDKRDGLVQIRSLPGRHCQAQRVAQAVDRDMDFGAKTTAATSQRLYLLTARFFGRRLRRDEHAQWWNRSFHFPYPGHRQSTGASVPRCPGRTSGQTACTPCSISRILLVKAAIGHRSGLSRAPLLHSGGSRFRYRHIHAGRFSENPAFSSIVHQ